MNEFLQRYLGEMITALIAGFGAWFFERKRKKVEVQNLNADYSKSIMEMYQNALTDLKDRYEERYTFLKNEYDLKFQHLNLKMEQMQKDQEMWKNKYTSLKKEIDLEKKKHQAEKNRKAEK